MLESFSFEVTLAASGPEALDEIDKSIGERPYDLVVMDWKMPGMDGIEAARRIRQEARLERKPAVILVTAYGREEVMLQAEGAGLDGFLVKPVSPSVLFDAVMQALADDAPKELRAAETKGAARELVESLAGARVLLAEDNEINQQVATEILAEVGVVVTVVNNGREALDALARASFDAVLMDVQMPVMDGYTATGLIRGNPEFATLPVIAMTAHAMAGDIEKSAAAGMNDHVAKPIDPDHLFETLVKWIAVPKVPRPEGGGRALRGTEARSGSDAAITTSVPPAFPSTLDGFELSAGLRRLGGNQALYRKLLADFAGGYAGRAQELRAALDARDYEAARSLAHDVKGLAGNLAADPLQSAAGAVEKLVKGADAASPPAEGALRDAMAALEAELARALRAAGSLAPAGPGGAHAVAASRGKHTAAVARAGGGGRPETA